MGRDERGFGEKRAPIVGKADEIVTVGAVKVEEGTT